MAKDNIFSRRALGLCRRIATDTHMHICTKQQTLSLNKIYNKIKPDIRAKGPKKIRIYNDSMPRRQ